MKRILLSFLLAGAALVLSAQNYHVSTTVQKKNVLLEEFTGVRCGYCPDGHKIAERLKTVLGERLSVVAIHCGYFAVGGTIEPEYRVEDGETLGDFLGGTYGSFPSATISRHDWEKSGSLLCHRGWWQEYTETRMEEDAPVNLWSKVVYDQPSQKMKIRVEGYFTAKEVEPVQHLNILLVQNDILGLQYGGGMADRYPHQHMLRDAITDALGDELSGCRPGEYFVKEYEYQVPEKFKDIAVDPAHLELVVFVTDAEKIEVQNVLTVKPEYVGEVMPLRASFKEDRIRINDGYGYRFFPLVLTNECNSTLTSATFEVTLNGETVETTWTGELPPFATEEIRIPVDWRQANDEQNSYRVALSRLNNVSFEGNVVEGTFGRNFSVPARMKMKVCTNADNKDNRYTLYDENGKKVQEFGPYGNEEVHEEDLVLENEKTYCLEMTNHWGGAYFPNGHALDLYDEAGQLLKTVEGYEGFGYRLFFATPEVTGIGRISTAEETERLYDRSGRRISRTSDTAPLAKGIYIVHKGKTVEKVIVR